MTKYVAIFLFLSLTSAASSEEIIDVWRTKTTSDSSTIHYAIALYKQGNHLQKITFRLEAISKDGSRILANVRGHSVKKPVSLLTGENCFHTEIYETFEKMENNYVVCETDAQVVMTQIELSGSSIMPYHLVFTNKQPSEQK